MYTLILGQRTTTIWSMENRILIEWKWGSVAPGILKYTSLFVPQPLDFLAKLTTIVLQIEFLENRRFIGGKIGNKFIQKWGRRKKFLWSILEDANWNNSREDEELFVYSVANYAKYTAAHLLSTCVFCVYLYRIRLHMCSITHHVLVFVVSFLFALM